jgi:hypothetical protein
LDYFPIFFISHLLDPFFKFYSFCFLSAGVDCQEPDSIRIPQNSLINLRENRPISLSCAATQQQQQQEDFV